MSRYKITGARRAAAAQKSRRCVARMRQAMQDRQAARTARNKEGRK